MSFALWKQHSQKIHTTIQGHFVNKFNRLLVRSTTGFLIATLSLAAKAQTSSPQDPSHLTINIETGITTSDPSSTNLLPNTVWVQRNVFDQLFEFDLKGRVQKGLVASVRVSADGKTVEIELKKNIWFQSSKSQGFIPSRPLDARDVAFTFDPAHHSAFPYWSIKGLDKLITSIKIDSADPSRFTFTLSEPRPDFFSVLAMGAFSIKSKEHWDFLQSKDAEWKAANPNAAPDDPTRPATWFERLPVGTGPYQVTSLANGRMELHASSQAVQPQTISLVPELDSRKRIQNVLAGEADIATSPTLHDFIEAKQSNPNTARFLSAPSQNINFLSINMQSPALNELRDPRVRRAISVAIDRKEIVQTIFSGEGQEAQSFIDPANFTALVTPENYKQNVTLARELVNASGANGKTLTLLYMPVSRPYNPDPLALALSLKRSIEAVGLQVRLATVGYDTTASAKDRQPILSFYGEATPANFQPDFSMYSAYVKKSPNFDIAQYGDNPLAPAAMANARGEKIPVALDRVVNVTTAGIGASNYARYSNPEIDRLYHSLNAEFDSAKREAIMNQINLIISQDLPIIPIGKVNVLRVVSPRVRYLFDPILQIERLSTRPARANTSTVLQCRGTFGG